MEAVAETTTRHGQTTHRCSECYALLVEKDRGYGSTALACPTHGFDRQILTLPKWVDDEIIRRPELAHRYIRKVTGVASDAMDENPPEQPTRGDYTPEDFQRDTDLSHLPNYGDKEQDVDGLAAEIRAALEPSEGDKEDLISLVKRREREAVVRALNDASQAIGREGDRRDAANKHAQPRLIGVAKGLFMGSEIAEYMAWEQHDPALRKRIPPNDPRDDKVS